MDKEDLKRIAENPKYITGIFNYCDRWCERCPFTGRCLNYELSENHFDDPDSRDINNNRFWNELSKALVMTLELIEEEAEKLGIDISNLDRYGDDEIYEVRERVIDENKNLRDAEEYIELVSKWFKISEKDFHSKQEQLILEESLDIGGTSPYEDALTITDAVEIIRWYQFQIFVKIKRALFSYIDKDAIQEDHQKDSDGSAKVALIGIDRSIVAWGNLYKNFNERQDDILDILIHLSHLRDNLEQEFPKARDFKRIGFDD